MSVPYFWNDITAYRKLPLAYPLRIARKACRKAIPSLPWLSAKAHNDGFWTNDHEISLRRSPLLAWPCSNVERCREVRFTKHLPGRLDILGNVLWPPGDTQTSPLRVVDVVGLCAQRRQEHSICQQVNIVESPLQDPLGRDDWSTMVGELHWDSQTFDRFDIIGELLVAQALGLEPVSERQLAALL